MYNKNKAINQETFFSWPYDTFKLNNSQIETNRKKTVINSQDDLFYTPKQTLANVRVTLKAYFRANGLSYKL